MSVAFAPAGCGPTTVRVTTRIKLAVGDGKLSATASADGATIRGACRIAKQPNTEFVLEKLRLNKQLRRSIDALLSWPVHQTIRDAVSDQVSGTIRT